jgi:heat shock protein HslJ
MKPLIFVVLSLILLVGCGPGKKTTVVNKEADPQMSNSTLSNSPWLLSILNGNVVHSQMERNPYIKFNPNEMSGNAGCNNFKANYSIQNNSVLTFGQFSITKMTCPDFAIENSFLNALKDTKSFIIKSDTLILLNSDRVALMKLLSVANLKE